MLDKSNGLTNTSYNAVNYYDMAMIKNHIRSCSEEKQPKNWKSKETHMTQVYVPRREHYIWKETANSMVIVNLYRLEIIVLRIESRNLKDFLRLRRI